MIRLPEVLGFIALIAGFPSGARAGQYRDLTLDMVVMITCDWKGNPVVGAGIIAGYEPGYLYVATADHVLRPTEGSPCENVQVRRRPAGSAPLRAKILEKHDPKEKLDLGVLKVPVLDSPESLRELPFDVLEKFGAGDLTLVGQPAGRPWRSSPPYTIVSRSSTQLRFTSTQIEPGYSGGPALTEISGGASQNQSDLIIGMLTSEDPPEGVVLPADALVSKIRSWGYPVALMAREVNLFSQERIRIDPSDPPRVLRDLIVANRAVVSNNDTISLLLWIGGPISRQTVSQLEVLAHNLRSANAQLISISLYDQLQDQAFAAAERPDGRVGGSSGIRVYQAGAEMLRDAKKKDAHPYNRRATLLIGFDNT
jgi:hypothetical protein